MTFSALHREDVLAQIRKEYGSAAAFERAHKFPTKSVNEVLRGRANARVSRAIELLLSNARAPLKPEYSANSAKRSSAHRLNAVAR